MSLNLIGAGYQAKTQCYIPVTCGEDIARDMTHFYALCICTL